MHGFIVIAKDEAIDLYRVTNINAMRLIEVCDIIVR